MDKTSHSIIHPQAIVESTWIGQGTRIWAFAHIMPGAVIGEMCNICEHCFVEGKARIGKGVVLKNGVSVWDKVILEDYVFVGPHAVFTNDPVPRAAPAFKTPPEVWEETRVREHATIGANATILCGIELGAYSFVAAGAVVTRSVRAYERVMGVPARHAGWVCRCGWFLADNPCQRCGAEFVIGEAGPVFERANAPLRVPGASSLSGAVRDATA